VLSEVRESDQGLYFDLSDRFPDGVYAYLLLKGNAGVDAETLTAFLRGRGRSVRAVHRVEQVHSARVVESDQAPCEADAVVVRSRGEAARVVTADCVPLLLAAGDGSAAAAVHAGWKGTLGRIAERGLDALGSPSARARAYIGPCVGPCCYTVDASRHAAFASQFPGIVPPAAPGSAHRLDLSAINAALLTSRGLLPENLAVESRCTACTVALCSSYRRDGERAGRMAAVVGLDG